jgi:hypothetical protein
LVNFPKGYITGSALPDKVRLRVKGQGWRLVSANVGAEAEFKVSVGSESGKKTISLYNYLESNRWLLSDVDIISVQPDSLKFFVEKIVSKKLPVIPDLKLEFKPGYGLASDIVLNPDSLIVFGPVSYLKPMQEIKTDTKFLGPLDSRIETEVNLPEMNGFRFNVDIIDVVLDVQKIVDKQFNSLTVEVIDIPTDKEVLLLPNKIGINIRGGIEILGKLRTDQFRAYVNYRDIVLDTTGSISPFLEMPNNVTLQFLKPERLRYIIKSF